jgi:hypothetical protein
MPSMRDLLESRGRTVAAMRELTESPEGDGGDLSDAQVKDFDRHKRELEATEAQISRQQLVDDAERRMAAPAIIHGNGRDGAYEQRARQFSLVKAINARLGEDVDAGFERELSAEVRRRSGRTFQGIAVPDQYFEVERRVVDIMPGASPDAVAGPLYPTVHRGDLFIDMLRSSLITARLGATILDGLVGDQDIPKQTGSSVAQWVPEDGALTETDPTFADVHLSPKTVGSLTSVTRRSLINAVPSIEGILRRDLAAVVSRAIDYAALFGTGAANTPTGVINQTDVVELSLATPSWAQVLTFPTTIQMADADLGSLGWAMSPRAAAKLRATNKVSGEPEHGFLMTTPTDLAGYPVVVGTGMPPEGSPQAATVVFGQFSQLLIGFWSGLDVLANPFADSAFPRGRVLIRAMRDVDVAVRHGEAFAYADDLVV